VTAQADADRAKKAAAKADETARQNQALTAQLAAQQKHVSDLERNKSPVAVPRRPMPVS